MSTVPSGHRQPRAFRRAASIRPSYYPIEFVWEHQGGCREPREGPCFRGKSKFTLKPRPCGGVLLFGALAFSRLLKRICRGCLVELMPVNAGMRSVFHAALVSRFSAYTAIPAVWVLDARLRAALTHNQAWSLCFAFRDDLCPSCQPDVAIDGLGASRGPVGDSQLMTRR